MGHALVAKLGTESDIRWMCLTGLALFASISSAACTGSEHTVLRAVDTGADPAPRRIRSSPASTASAGSMAPSPSALEEEPEVAPPETEPMEVDAAVPPPPPPDPRLDPDVEFNWAETLPGRGTCRSGVYVGSFECVIEGLWLVTGQVVLELEGSTEQQLLRVVDGKVGDLAGELFEAGVEGQLDCITKHFYGLTAGGIAYTVPRGETPPPFVLPYQGFDASLLGDLDDQELVISGPWALSYEYGGRCVGTWTASAQP